MYNLDLNTLSLVYESQYGNLNKAPVASRIFPNCKDCRNCSQNQTYAGPSSGALVLSALQEFDAVKIIEVFGMNWHGDRAMHIDFADSNIVTKCCHKCLIHDTRSIKYGNPKALRWLTHIYRSSIIYLFSVLQS